MPNHQELKTHKWEMHAIGNIICHLAPRTAKKAVKLVALCYYKHVQVKHQLILEHPLMTRTCQINK